MRLIIEDIARVAYEINKVYCESIGDNSQPNWFDAAKWQKDSVINGVQFVIDNPNSTPDSSHTNWVSVKNSEGWKWGPIKNMDTKEHPCFLPYSELPIEQKIKDSLFIQTVKSLYRNF